MMVKKTKNIKWVDIKRGLKINIINPHIMIDRFYNSITSELEEELNDESYIPYDILKDVSWNHLDKDLEKNCFNFWDKRAKTR